jgi:hypothetical protein
LIYHGEHDKVLLPGVTELAFEYYTKLGADVQYFRNPSTAHPIPTDLPEEATGQQDLTKFELMARKKVPAGNRSFPYINNCGFDVAGMMLKYLLPKVTGVAVRERNLDWNSKGKLIAFNQLEFLPSSIDDNTLSKAGIANHAYLYIPNVCLKKSCHLHIVLHGSSQSAPKLGRTFPTQTGYLEYAASNDLVVLFP